MRKPTPVPGSSGSPAAASDDASLMSLRFLRHKLQRVVGESTNTQEALTRAADVLASVIGGDCMLWVTLSQAGPGISGLNLPADGLAASTRNLIFDRAGDAITGAVTHVAALPGHELHTICAPLTTGNDRGVLVVLYTAARHSVSFATVAVEIAAGAIASAENHRAWLRADGEAEAAAVLIDIVEKTESAPDLDQAARTLCRELADATGSDIVAVGLVDSQGVPELVADTGTESLGLAEAVFQESLMRGVVTTHPPVPGEDRHGLLAHRKLAEDSRHARVMSVPLILESGKTVGALLLAGNEERQAESAALLLSAGAPRLAAAMDLIARSERRGLEKLIHRTREVAGGNKSRLVFGLLAALCLLMCLPFSYQVKATCELQPLNHRYVAAPFDGPLEACLVEPGDVVEQDQVLARMDGRELWMNLAGINSDRNRAAMERDIHRAKGDYGAAEMSRLQMEAFSAREQLLEHRGHHLEIKSPAAGVVVSGDWKRSEGVPLTTGETLFEIAPLDRMIVEISIPADDIAHVETGQEVEVRLEAYPSEVWSGKLLNIHPASEVRDHEHIYVGEVELVNSDLRMRPGMRGHARIRTAAGPLVWNVFHKPWNRFVAWLRFSL